MSILRSVDSPADLKGMTVSQLEQLAAEIRSEIIAVTEKNGGHLSSNLGVVELTIALHRVYDCPKDKLIFDVGHQCYAHKLLTGRRDSFSSLRQKDGISGFPRMEESEFDAFGAGHSGTAISAAVGYARVRRVLGQEYHIAAIVGDGSFMNGPNIEAFNDAGHCGEPLVVILNDNEMSIDKNVGALAKYLAEMRAKPGYQQAKKRTKSALDSIPYIGRPIKNAIRWGKYMLRRMLFKGQLFEDLGYSYLGPVDGHDIRALTDALQAAREIERPVLLHVKTIKGYGYSPAQEHPEKYHGVGPSETEKPFSYTETVAATLLELGKEDERLCVLTAAMRKSTGALPFSKAYPDRFFDVGIAESHAVTMAAALAAAGMHPCFAVYATFLQRGYDQILHDVALQNLPVHFVVTHVGLVGQDGATHSGTFALSYLLQVPNLTVLIPKDEAELAYLLKWMQHTIAGPAALCFEKVGLHAKKPVVPMEAESWPCLRKGNDLAICCVGSMNEVALEAASLLETRGIRASVYDARLLKPLPEDALAVLKGYSYIVTLEENALYGGFGSLLRLSMDTFGIHMLNLGIPDCFVPHASRMQQREAYGLSAERIADRIEAFLREDT